MSNGFGAGFGWLMILAVLGLVAVGLALASVAAVVFERRRGAIPDALRYLVAILTAAAVAVGGFGILALYDEAVLTAVSLVGLVALPLVLVAGRARMLGTPWIGVVATAGLAWCLPFLVGVGVLFGLTVANLEPPVVLVVVLVLTVVGALLAGEYARDLVSPDLT